MSDNARYFIERLEAGDPPMDCGHIFYDSGIFSSPVWYRFHPATEEWQWTPDLIYWNSIESDIAKEGIWQNYQLSSDNQYIIHYLRLKSINKNINHMEDSWKNTCLKLAEISNYLSSEKFPIEIPESLAHNESLQNYTNQISFENNRINELKGRIYALEYELINGRNTRNTQLSAQVNLNDLRIELIDAFIKYYDLVVGLNKYINTIITNDSQEYRRRIENACYFLEGSGNQIEDNRLNYAVWKYQERLLKHMGIHNNYNNIIDGNEKLFNQIESLNDASQSIQSHLARINSLCKKLEMSKQTENDLRREIVSLEKDNKSLNSQIDTMESIQEKLIASNESLKANLVESDRKSINLENRISELEMELFKVKCALNASRDLENERIKNVIQSALNICPELEYNHETKQFIKKEDNYELLDVSGDD